MNTTAPVKQAFQPKLVTLPIAKITPLKEIAPVLRRAPKYKQIEASLQYLGVVEPVVVFPHGNDQYWLLDGHLRLDIMKARGVNEVKCLLATDDETYTYNKRVNSLPAIAEHQMILKAITSGVPEQRIAAALNVDVAKIRKKRSLLDGICPEAANLLKEKRITPEALSVVKKMKPVRQVEAAELMIASNCFSVAFARALVSVTSPEFLVDPVNPRKTKTSLSQQAAMMEEETRTLVKDLKAAEESYGTDILNLTVAARYMERLLRNRQVKNFLAKHHADILAEIDQLLAAVEENRSKGKVSRPRTG